MADPLKKVAPGDRLKISAAAYNAFVDAARYVQDRQQGQGQPAQPAARRENIILVRNDSGTDRERFDVLGISAPLFPPGDEEDRDAFKNQVALVGVTPTVADHAGRFVITLEPIAAGELGRAWIAGVCPAWVDVQAEGDQFADVNDGDCAALKSGSSGAAQILWKEAGTGPLWAVVRLGPDRPAVREGVITDDFDFTTGNAWLSNAVTVWPWNGTSYDAGTVITLRIESPGNAQNSYRFSPELEYRLRPGMIVPYLPDPEDPTHGIMLPFVRWDVRGKLTANWVTPENHVHVKLLGPDGADINATVYECQLFSPSGVEPAGLDFLTTNAIINVRCITTHAVGEGGAITPSLHVYAVDVFGGDTANTAHDLLSARHGDTLPSAVAQGGLVYGNATPKWAQKAIGAVGDVLTVVEVGAGLEPEWEPPAEGGTGGGGGASLGVDKVFHLTGADAANETYTIDAGHDWRGQVVVCHYVKLIINGANERAAFPAAPDYLTIDAGHPAHTIEDLTMPFALLRAGDSVTVSASAHAELNGAHTVLAATPTLLTLDWSAHDPSDGTPDTCRLAWTLTKTEFANRCAWGNSNDVRVVRNGSGSDETGVSDGLWGNSGTLIYTLYVDGATGHLLLHVYCQYPPQTEDALVHLWIMAGAVKDAIDQEGPDA